MFGGFFILKTELEEPGKRQFHFGATAGNVGQQGTNSGNVAVGHQWNGYAGKRGGNNFFVGKSIIP